MEEERRQHDAERAQAAADKAQADANMRQLMEYVARLGNKVGEGPPPPFVYAPPPPPPPDLFSPVSLSTYTTKYGDINVNAPLDVHMDVF